jgi:hypothetical protein
MFSIENVAQVSVARFATHFDALAAPREVVKKANVLRFGWFPEGGPAAA